MSLGFSNLRDVIDVLLVPLSAALLAVLWPFFTAQRRRHHFDDLIRFELLEARPTERTPDKLWHEHIPRRFIHQELIEDPIANMEFILSMKPELTYNLSQMWKAFEDACDDQQHRRSTAEDAHLFCKHLFHTGDFLDRHRGWRHRAQSRISEQVWRHWHDLIREFYPDHPDRHDGPDDVALAG